MQKRYTPPLERVWAEWHRRERARKMQAARRARGEPERAPIPDSSEPWLPHPPRTLEDLLYISEQVAETKATWFKEFPPSSET